jgi:hypothetical protein
MSDDDAGAKAPPSLSEDRGVGRGVRGVFFFNPSPRPKYPTPQPLTDRITDPWLDEPADDALLAAFAEAYAELMRGEEPEPL